MFFYYLWFSLFFLMRVYGLFNFKLNFEKEKATHFLYSMRVLWVFRETPSNYGDGGITL
jgi:hypothetical protein